MFYILDVFSNKTTDQPMGLSFECVLLKKLLLTNRPLKFVCVMFLHFLSENFIKQVRAFSSEKISEFASFCVQLFPLFTLPAVSEMNIWE